MSNATNLSSFIWSAADLLKGSYKQSDYGKVIFPFTVLRRLDCILEPTRRVLEEFKRRTSEGVELNKQARAKDESQFVQSPRFETEMLDSLEVLH
jgi:type I restriction enzyme M protein